MAETLPLPPLKGRKLIVAAGVLALANFFTVLDLTICNVSVPNIAGGLAVSPNEGTWVITSYGVAEAITVPLTGWLAQRFGTVRVFVSAMMLFGICSGLCGLATSLPMLVAARVLQGLAGGPMIPLSQTLLLSIFPREKLAQATGLWAMTTVIAPIIGPILGGHLCDTVGWPWIFFINVPVTIVCAFVGARVLRSRETARQRLPIDVVGLGLMILWIGALQIMLDKGRELDWFASPTIQILCVVAVVGFVAFLIWELTDEHPIVNLRVFRFRAFAIGASTISLSYSGFLSTAVLVPLWLQTNLGYTATSAGQAVGVNGILAFIFAPIVGRLLGTGKFDARLFMSVGIFWFAIVTYMRTRFNTDMTFIDVAIWNFAQGLAIPFFFISGTNIALVPIPANETASAAGLMSFMRTLGGAFGTSIVTTSWDSNTTMQKNALVGVLNNSQSAVDRLMQNGLTQEQATSQFDLLVQKQSVMLATNEVFQWTAVVFLVAALLIWLAPRPKGALSVAAH